MASGATGPIEQLPTVEQVRRLPCFYRAEITRDHLDAMGHMNIRWYLAFYDEAAWAFFATFGMDEHYFRERRGGGFALQHHLRYLAEVRLGECVAVHGRLLSYSAKRIHFMGFMINETQGRLASTLEALGAHADMNTRRLSPFPPDLAENLARVLERDRALEWEAPVSGVMRP
jgi:acyl-CoA thioester hydrolase